MLRKILKAQRFLIGKKSIMHHPVLSLIERAADGLGRFECVFVRFQGEIPENKFYLAGLDVFALDLRLSLAEMAAAKGALIIGELDENQFSVFISFGRLVIDIQKDRLGV